MENIQQVQTWAELVVSICEELKNGDYEKSIKLYKEAHKKYGSIEPLKQILQNIQVFIFINAKFLNVNTNHKHSKYIKSYSKKIPCDFSKLTYFCFFLIFLDFLKYT